jgi:streptogramin lyase
MSLRTAGRWTLGTLLALGLGAAPARAAVITEPPLTMTSGAEPWEIATGTDGALWFTEYGNPGAVGRHVPGGAGAVDESPADTPNNHPRGLAVGPGGNLWFTLKDGIGKVTPAGVVTEYNVDLSSADPWAIALGPNGDMWFTEASDDRIARIDAMGTITEFPVLADGTEPHGIAPGPDGNMWFTLKGDGGEIGRITPMGVVTVFGTLSSSEPENIVAGPDGNLWFTDAKDPGVIGRITPQGVVTEFPLPTDDRKPYGITAGNDGALWFTFTGDDGGVGRITTSGAITLHDLPTDDTQPRGITTGPDGNIWVTETAVDKLAHVLVAPASKTLPPIAVGHDAATLQGRVGPNAQNTQRRFEWGATTAYGNATPLRGAGNGSGPVDVSEPLAGLDPGTTYHYRLVATNGSGSTPGDDMTFSTGAAPTPTAAQDATPSPPAGGPAPTVPAPAFTPRLGSVVVVRPSRGTVTVRRPGSRTATRLGADGGTIPVGSVVDTRKGAVELISALDNAGRTQTGTFSAGRFEVRQPRGANGRTDLLLRGGKFKACRRAGRAATASTAGVRAVTSAKRKRSRRAVRRLWGSDNGGRFRTHGRDSVATVRGTRWLTLDRCDGTVTRVTEGAVAVRDRRRGRTVLVKAGRSYFARHKR